MASDPQCPLLLPPLKYVIGCTFFSMLWLYGMLYGVQNPVQSLVWNGIWGYVWLYLYLITFTISDVKQPGLVPVMRSVAHLMCQLLPTWKDQMGHTHTRMGSCTAQAEINYWNQIGAKSELGCHSYKELFWFITNLGGQGSVRKLHSCPCTTVFVELQTEHLILGT